MAQSIWMKRSDSRKRMDGIKGKEGHGSDWREEGRKGEGG